MTKIVDVSGQVGTSRSLGFNVAIGFVANSLFKHPFGGVMRLV